jgi:hypothetical protein
MFTRQLLLATVFNLIFLRAAFAHQVTVIGPCSEKPLFQIESVSKAATLGDLTVEVFQKHQIPFEGDRSSIRSIQNSPVGDEALEILSDRQMRAYGWCVTVNGEEPGEMPDQVVLSRDSKIVWFYAYSLYDSGSWKTMCSPSYRLQSPFVCSQKPQLTSQK